MADKKIWVVSTEPPRSNFGNGPAAESALSFREEISAERLKKMMFEFTDAICDILSELPDESGKYSVDQVEINAVMATDGHLGIMGSSLGGSAEGGITLIFRRREPDD